MVGSSLVETAERTPTLDDTVAWDAIDAPGPHRPVLRVPHRHHDDRVRRRHPAGGAGAAGDAGTGGGAVADWASGCATHVEYETGTTSVSTTAVEVLRAGRGVCQDYAHLGIAVLRAAGIPARYASGYLYPDELGGVVGETHQGESHAWLEAWVGDWHPLDPTSGSPVAERHVLVAAWPRLLRRRAAQGRVPRRSEPLTRRHGGAHTRRVDGHRGRVEGHREVSRTPGSVAAWSAPSPNVTVDHRLSTAPRPSTRSRPARSSSSTCARSSGSPAPTSAATRRRAARARCCSTASR